MEQEIASNQNSLEELLSQLPHTVISTTRFSEKELREKIEEKTPVRSRYSVGEFYIPNQLFTIEINYSLPIIRERPTSNSTIRHVVPSELHLQGKLLSQYDEHGRLTIEGYVHPEIELETFRTGNVESATIIKLPELFRSIPQLQEEVTLYPAENSSEPLKTNLAELALSKINAHSYTPNALLMTGLDFSIKNYILGLKGPCGKPIYDGALGMHVQE